MRLTALSRTGVESFRTWLQEGARRKPPHALLREPGCFRALPKDVTIDPRPPAANRYALGTYLVDRLGILSERELHAERADGLWAALALLWFKFLCPRGPGGKRKPGKPYLWIPSADWRHRHRHMVKPCWELVRAFGSDARLMLLASRESADSLRKRGEVYEQLASRLPVMTNRWALSSAIRLYADPETGRPKPGAAGRGAGSIRRMGAVFTQLDLTYDLPSVPADQLGKLMPAEFDRWRQIEKP